MVRITSMELAMFFLMSGVRGHWLFTGEGGKKRLVYDFDIPVQKGFELERDFKRSPVGKFLKAKRKLEMVRRIKRDRRPV